MGLVMTLNFNLACTQKNVLCKMYDKFLFIENLFLSL
jgi:hypothetical protein